MFQRLQMVLNAAARLVVGTGKSATSPKSSMMYSTGSPYSTKSATKSPYWLGTVFTHRPGSFRWRLRSCDCSLWTNNLHSATRGDLVIPRTRTNKIGRTEFPYIRTDGVELAPWFAQAFCYKPRTFPKRTENISIQESLRTSLWALLKSELIYLLTTICWEWSKSQLVNNLHSWWLQTGNTA